MGLGKVKKQIVDDAASHEPDVSASDLAAEALVEIELGPTDDGPISSGGGTGLSSLRKYRPSDADHEYGGGPSQPEELQVAFRVRAEKAHRPDTGWKLLEVEHGSKRVILKTTFPTSCEPGDHITARGTWKEYKGKEEFVASTITVDLPRDSAAVVKWLSSKTVPGVSKGTADRLYRHFREDLRSVITDPEAMAQAGIPMEKAEAIAHKWTNHALDADVVTRLLAMGLKQSQISAVMRRYGAAAIRVIEEYPWRLAVQIEGVAFPTADYVAIRSGKHREDPERLKSAFGYILKDAVNSDGHCALSPETLRLKAKLLLSLNDDVVVPALEEFKNSPTIEYDRDRDLIAPRSVRNSERELAADIVRLCDEPGFPIDEVRAAIAAAEATKGIVLDPSQRDAATLALTNRFCVITGGPGTGKSTTQKVVVEALRTLGVNPHLAAPTGRAAKRLQEVSGLPAETCHRMLSFRAGLGGFLYDRENPHPTRWLVKDETSMIDLKLAGSVMQAVAQGAGVTMVGDVDQLPSVGPGQVLRDIIDSGSVPVARLQTVHRQGKDSGIVLAATRINAGDSPLLPGERGLDGFDVHDLDDDANLVERLVSYVTETLPRRGWDPRTDIQVLMAQKRGPLGSLAVNARIKDKLNPADPATSVVQNGTTYSLGDRVIHIRNNHKKSVYNGEVGFVVDIRKEKDERKSEVVVDYEDRTIVYQHADLSELELCWASTIHKAQGSEYPVVVIMLPRSHQRMMTRNLVYTGVTRAKQLCVVVGDMEIVQQRVRLAVERRNTHLSTDIQEAVSELVLEKERDAADLEAATVRDAEGSLYPDAPEFAFG